MGINMQERIKAQNANTARKLIEQLRSPYGVILFVGAGLSKALGFPEWGDAIRTLAQDAGPEVANRVIRLLEKDELQRAADAIALALGENAFQRAIDVEFSDHRLAGADLSIGPLGILPFMTTGPVITTNFDRVVERAFAYAGREFNSVVKGPNPDEVVPALQQNRFVLWKIHGDWQDRRTRVLTETEYEQSYRELGRLLWLALTNRPVLFIGCSLEHDRVVTILEEIQDRDKGIKGITHFAIVQAPEQEQEFHKRATDMQRLGIMPLWYPTGHHELIKDRMVELLGGMASMPLPANSAKKPVALEENTKLYPQARQKLQSELDILREEVRRDEPIQNVLPPYAQILDRMTKGEIVFFLGAYANLERLPLAGGFYQDLARRLDMSSYDLGGVDIAQNFADKHERGALYTLIYDILHGKTADPTAIHWFIATLRRRLQEKGYNPAPLMILTTNNDDWMEVALQETGERYHLFSYRREEPYRGCYIHCSPDGEVRAIDRPSDFRELAGDSTILVKYHGGFQKDMSLPPSYVVTGWDFNELAGRVPAAIPRAILDRLESTSLLFLGHGLADASVEALVRELKSARPNNWTSWAIQFPAKPAWQAYWKELGVQILFMGLTQFIVELDRRLDEWPRAMGR